MTEGTSWRPREASGKHLGGGVVLYESAVETNWGALACFAEESAEKEREVMYTPGKDPISGEEGFINRNGYFFPADSVYKMPQHCAYVQRDASSEIKEILELLQNTTDKCLLDYLNLFPLAGKCIWWKIKSHILFYPEDAYLGMHSDQSVDYEYGSPHPSDQIATRTTVSTIAFFNDHVETEEELDGTNFMGGLVQFGYLGIEYVPKKGDILFFPSNYMAAHGVTMVKGGSRYSHVGWYCHGSPNSDFNEAVLDPIEQPDLAKTATNVYMTEGYNIL